MYSDRTWVITLPNGARGVMADYNWEITGVSKELREFDPSIFHYGGNAYYVTGVYADKMGLQIKHVEDRPPTAKKERVMGYYINPEDCSKEDFLLTHGRLIPVPAMLEHLDYTEHLPVCWVDNGRFSAAAICYDKDEMQSFMRSDGRLKVWFLVSRKLLKPYYPGV